MNKANMSALEEMECNCIDTATPDTETYFECDSETCDTRIRWRTDDAYHWQGGHWHSFCLLEYFVAKAKGIKEAEFPAWRDVEKIRNEIRKTVERIKAKPDSSIIETN